jgi:hypothetical protein
MGLGITTARRRPGVGSAGARVPGRSGTRIGRTRSSSRGVLARPRAFRRRNVGGHAGGVAPAHDVRAPSLPRPPAPGRRRIRQRRPCGSVREGTAGSCEDSAPLPVEADRVPGRLLPRPLTRERRLGIGRGLDTRPRATPIRQGPAHRDQRDPRCARRRGHHRDQTGQHRSNHHRTAAPRPGGRLRPAATGGRSALRSAVVTSARLRRPADRNDPSHRSGLRHRPLAWWRRVGRFLGGQDPHRAPGPPARRCP